jgi:glucuronide carrier protein
VTSIRVAAGALPAGLILGAVAVMLAYPLTEKAFRALVAEMAQRRVGEVAAALDAADPVDIDPGAGRDAKG